MTTTLVDAIAEGTRAVLAPLDVDQHPRMIAVGVLPEGSPIELIDGLLIRKDRRDSMGDITTVGISAHNSQSRCQFERSRSQVSP